MASARLVPRGQAAGLDGVETVAAAWAVDRDGGAFSAGPRTAILTALELRGCPPLLVQRWRNFACSLLGKSRSAIELVVFTNAETKPCLADALAGVSGNGSIRWQVEIADAVANASTASTRHPLHLESQRWLRYAGFLEQAASSDLNALAVSDSLDVVFQDDPFARLLQPNEMRRIRFFSERQHTIGTQPLNYGWVDATYGREMVTNLSNRSVSCAGFTIGGATAMRAYIRLMAQEIYARVRPLRWNLLGPNFYRGLDQGVHNVAVHMLLAVREPTMNATISDHRGPVLTGDNMNGQVLELPMQGGLASRETGRMYIVVHQSVPTPQWRHPQGHGDATCKHFLRLGPHQAAHEPDPHKCTGATLTRGV